MAFWRYLDFKISEAVCCTKRLRHGHGESLQDKMNHRPNWNIILVIISDNLAHGNSDKQIIKVRLYPHTCLHNYTM